MGKSLESWRWFVFACALAFFEPVTARAEPGASNGPDVVVTAITGVANYDSETPPGAPGPIDAFSVGTIACNAGDATLPLVSTDPQHFILRQGMFRLEGGRFEQIGTSWVKHIFPASNEPGTCGLECDNPNVSGPELRPGCTDANSAGINGDRVYTSRAYQVNPFTGVFPFPTSVIHAETAIDQRIQVRHSDLDPAHHPGATYFVEAHYIHPDDAAEANGDNNATFARVMLSDPGTGTYVMTITSPALNRGQNKPAVLAWQDADTSVTTTYVRVPLEGLFIVAAKATSLPGGYWHYEYAVENLNSDRAGAWFQVPKPEGAQIQNVGFHDVDYHSGEPQQGTDWSSMVLGDSVAWQMESTASSDAANALRWSTLYNFRFDANVGPAPTTCRLGLFKPGTPAFVEFDTIGPALGLMDCNGNQRLDACDVDCSAVPSCPAPCGNRPDVNDNGIPDECETDCNNNDVPDDWEAGQTRPDCNENHVPDECDPDCDGDDVPDNCETVQDVDSDGFPDCLDQCPTSTPPGVCAPPEQIMCLFPGGLCVPYSRSLCLAQGYVAYCGASGLCDGQPCPDNLCRDGCLPSDYDGDADGDLRDFSAYERCFSDEPPLETPSDLCLSRFDLDDDGDVDLNDLGLLQSHWTEPR